MALMQLPGHGFGMAAGLCHWLCSQLVQMQLKAFWLPDSNQEYLERLHLKCILWKSDKKKRFIY